MKRIFMLFFALLMLFALTACGNGDIQAPSPSTVNAETPTEGTEETTAPTPVSTVAPTTVSVPALAEEPTAVPIEQTSAAATEKPAAPPTEKPTIVSTEQPTAETTKKPATSSTQAPSKEPTVALTTCSHIWNNATCTEPKTCSVCGESDGTAIGHIWNNATCNAPMTCKNCGATEGTSIGHIWNDASCTEPMTCKNCGETDGMPVGHFWSVANCTAPMTCEICGETDGDVVGHSWGNWKETDNYRDLCAEDGTQYRTCYKCRAKEERAVKAAHSYSEGYCTRCEARDADYAFVYIDFKDKLFEAYIKQALGLPPESNVATVDMKKLTSFTIEDRVSNVEALKYAANLESITIKASNVSNLDVLSALPITSVHLGYNGGIADIDVSFMKKLKEVKSVWFYDCRITGGSMKDVVSSPKLTYYKYFINYLRNESTGSIDYLSGATNIETLSLWNDFESDTDISVLTTLTKLKKAEFNITGLQLKDFTEQQYAVIDQLILSGIKVDIIE